MSSNTTNRAKLLANNYVKLLPIVEANYGTQGPAIAAMYSDGVVLYVHGDVKLQDAVTTAIRQDREDISRSDDGCLTVFVLTSGEWAKALDEVNSIVPVAPTDNRQSDWPTISEYVELISRTLSTGRDSDADR